MIPYRWKRHPFSVTADFRQCLVLTYAFPANLLQPLLPPGLSVDRHGDLGFLAVALVDTENMRPSFLPASLGQSFFLCGYRIFTRLGTSLRGLRILRSYTDRPLMVCAGNLLTHYNYRLCQVRKGATSYDVRTDGGEADLSVEWLPGDTKLPQGSPFASIQEARRFAGPLPYTFDYEPQTHSVIRIQGQRSSWSPQPVGVRVYRNSFLEQEPFCRATPILANAFLVKDIPYRWLPGTVEAL